ncbi:PD-(D/E)XK nuclease family protein [Pseudomonas sp.]|uniref:PD-(D/E)XK nuclease family protein n=1 Tax=Pseudomonas sp. TaxID=306 RepID=UPI0025883C35|nr:PD-(D/E)XK nuclease family protein [Pseudomonas sp.]
MTELIPHVQIPPQTHSSLQTFDLCPRQYDAKYRSKTIKFEQSYEGQWGDEAHKHLEDQLKAGGAYQFPSRIHKDSGQDMASYQWIGEALLARAKAKGGYVLAERKFAIGYDRDTDDYWNRDTWLRGKIDVTIIYPKLRLAEVTDLKTGKKKDDPLQVDLYSVSAMLDYTEVDTVKAGYIWGKYGPDKAIDKPKVYTRADIEPILNTFSLRTDEVKHAWASGNFPPKPNFLCGKWCDVFTCEFNGRKS